MYSRNLIKTKTSCFQLLNLPRPLSGSYLLGLATKKFEPLPNFSRENTNVVKSTERSSMTLSKLTSMHLVGHILKEAKVEQCR